MSKSWCRLVMLCRKAKNAEERRVASNFFATTLGDFRHPLKITLPPPGRNPETAPVAKVVIPC